MSETKNYSVVVETVARMMVPFIQLFALYVIFHGESSPGGGFQGGVIFGTSVIMRSIVFGLHETRKKFIRKRMIALMSLGLLVYSGVGAISLLSGGRYLEYSKLPITLPPAELNALAILAVELGIAITVMSVMILLFLSLTGD